MNKFISNNQYPLLIAGCGLVLAMLLLTIGFFKTVFLILLTVGGFYLGKYMESNGWFTNFFDKDK